MPAKIYMNIMGRNGLSSHTMDYQRVIEAKQKQMTEQRQKVNMNDMRSMMIQRVHTAKPGCSACGK